MRQVPPATSFTAMPAALARSRCILQAHHLPTALLLALACPFCHWEPWATTQLVQAKQAGAACLGPPGWHTRIAVHQATEDGLPHTNLDSQPR